MRRRPSDRFARNYNPPGHLISGRCPGRKAIMRNTLQSIRDPEAQIIEFGPGVFVDNAATDLAELADLTGRLQVGVFNDTPISAAPGDNTVLIVDRWNRERPIVQKELERDRRYQRQRLGEALARGLQRLTEEL